MSCFQVGGQESGERKKVRRDCVSYGQSEENISRPRAALHTLNAFDAHDAHDTLYAIDTLDAH